MKIYYRLILKLKILIATRRAKLFSPSKIKLKQLLTYKLGRLVFTGEMNGQAIICKVVKANNKSLLINEEKKLNTIQLRFKSAKNSTLIPRSLGIFDKLGNSYYIEEMLSGESSVTMNKTLLNEALQFSIGLFKNTLEVNDSYQAPIASSLLDVLPQEYLTYTSRLSIFMPEERQSYLQHGDFWSNNILVDPKTNEITGVIDWEESEHFFVGYDICHLFLMNENNLHSKEIGELVAEYLTKPCADFSQMVKKYFSGINLDTPDINNLLITYWMVFVMNSHRQLSISDRSRKWKNKNILKPLSEINKFLSPNNKDSL
ncbi:MAG: phosphotransferase [Colwellia sp.]|nr:phosphotransferase [Colwellia sp.]